MRHRAAVAVAGFALALVLLVNFRSPEDLALIVAAGNAPSTSAGDSGAPSTSGQVAVGGSGAFRGSTGSTGPAGPASPPSAALLGPSSPPSAAPLGPKTYTGKLVANPFGEVQVAITVQSGKIIDVQALSLPVGGHSGRISRFVEPILRKQALTAQSANINGVSGATYTSRAYANSLQSALDAAGL